MKKREKEVTMFEKLQVAEDLVDQVGKEVKGFELEMSAAKVANSIFRLGEEIRKVQEQKKEKV